MLLGFPDPLDLATGIEKKEMLMRLAGNDVSFKNYYLIVYKSYCISFSICIST